MQCFFHFLVLYFRRGRSILHAGIPRQRTLHSSTSICTYFLSTPLKFPRSCSYNTSFSTTSESSLRTSRALDAATLSFFSKYTLFPSYTQLCSDLAFAYAYAWRATTGIWDLLPCIWWIGAFDFLIHERALRALDGVWFLVWEIEGTGSGNSFCGEESEGARSR